ncbi:MAG: hypothetical protein KIT02_05545 [Devosia sp.]|uniref:curli-like amyloid fiber formation chaperone CsgH n=1 Tax=Devosia sp. TaxID=1871048 RepID=UPI0024C51503|nr:curli-like amyloid fiber formation chaperone CsgH [Devosia sp.]UYO00677.1 MAG: hypothetical protein KIT02_05545 [Devosia sp.]
MILTSLRLGLAGLAVVGAAGMAIGASSAPVSDLACGVSTVTKNGMMAIEGVVQSPEPLAGEYRFSLKSSSAGGNTNIRQGGAFTLPANDVVTLGRVMVNAGSNLDIDFTVTTDGQTIDCSQQLVTHT